MRKALVVGINYYKGSAALFGCVQDACSAVFGCVQCKVWTWDNIKAFINSL